MKTHFTVTLLLVPLQRREGSVGSHSMILNSWRPASMFTIYQWHIMSYAICTSGDGIVMGWIFTRMRADGDKSYRGWRWVGVKFLSWCSCYQPVEIQSQSSTSVMIYYKKTTRQSSMGQCVAWCVCLSSPVFRWYQITLLCCNKDSFMRRPCVEPA